MLARPSLPRLVLVAACLAPTATPARAADEAPGRKYAVLVGVSEYKSSAELRNLRATVNDAVKLREVLLAGGYRAEDITLLTSQGAGKLKPTGENITAAIAETARRCRPEDTLIVAFAGHGLQFQDDPQPYFCPYDAAWRDRSTLVPLLKVFEQVGACPAKRKLLMVDACRNDPQADTAGREENAKTVAKGFSVGLPAGSDVVALLGCKNGQFSHEDSRLDQGNGHGVFFYHVILGLAGDAAGKDGTVSLAGLVNYVQPKVQEYVKKEFDADQEPFQLGQAGLFPILRLTTATEGDRLMREALLAEGRKDTAAAREKYNQAIELDKKNPDAYYRRGLLSLGAAKAIRPPADDADAAKKATEQKKELFHDAARDFTRAAKFRPEFIAAYLRRADANYYLDNLDAALQDYEEALDMDPNAVEVLVDRAYVYLGMEKPDKAVRDLDKAIAANPEYARAYYVRGAAKIASQQNEDGVRDIDQALAMEPQNPIFAKYKLELAVSTGSAEQVAQEEARLERVAAYVPRTDVVNQERIYVQRNTVGTYYQSAGQSDRAERTFDRAAREAERMPALQQRALEARVRQLESFMSNGQGLKANAKANEIRNSLPPGMRKEFDQQWKQSQQEERWNRPNNQNRQAGPFNPPPRQNQPNNQNRQAGPLNPQPRQNQPFNPPPRSGKR